MKKIVYIDSLDKTVIESLENVDLSIFNANKTRYKIVDEKELGEKILESFYPIKLNSDGIVERLSSDELENKIDKITEEVNEQQLREIDNTSNLYIMRGFEFDNHVFSLSKSAQLNWNRILSMFSLGLLSSKTEVSTKNNDVYILTSEQVKPFATAYHNAIESVLKYSRKQKLNID